MSQEKNHGRPNWEGAETEYTSLRNEILLRIRQRSQIVAGTLALGGVFLGAGLTMPALALVYPTLAFFLALSWAQNDFRTRDLARYIRKEIEPVVPGIGWESYVAANRKKDGLGSWRYVVLAHGGLFLFTQAMALYLGLNWLLSDSPQDTHLRSVGWTLLVFDVAAILGVIRLLRRAIR